MLAAPMLLRSTLPPVPFAGCEYKTTLTDTANDDTTTFSSVDIGTPHPKRVICVCGNSGSVNNMTVTVNGIKHYWRSAGTSHYQMCLIAVPNDTTATIVVTASASTRKGVSVYVCYPNNPIPLDEDIDAAGTTSNAVVTNIKVQKGGCVIYCGGQINAAGASFTTTWSGTDTPVEDYDATVEPDSSVTTGAIKLVTVSTDNDDMTMAEAVSGTKNLSVVSLGPPPPCHAIAI